MSLWWVRKDQLDSHQMALIENLPLRESHLILGPPGSGKTNVLLRRAQFVRGQDMPNVLVLTFTRPLTEFVKTGCFDPQGREIFPKSCVTTIESWLRWLYNQHDKDLPSRGGEDLTEWKKDLAVGALDFQKQKRIPKYDALFVDEAQDLLPEEVALLARWSDVLFFVGDDRQRIYENTQGLTSVRKILAPGHEHKLPFHYRLAPEICHMADRILLPESGQSLEETCHYVGPRPGTIEISGPLPNDQQLEQAAAKLKDQIRVYAGLIREGDRLGVIVARKRDRETVHAYFENDPLLEGKSKIIRAREEDEHDYDPSFEPDSPICILTVKGCKGLEFRAVHWLFSDDLSWTHRNEHYYTVVTRAKTSLDIYYTGKLSRELAGAYSRSAEPW
jgi:superfamily I DNA/RNA helicase